MSYFSSLFFTSFMCSCTAFLDSGVNATFSCQNLKVIGLQIHIKCYTEAGSVSQDIETGCPKLAIVKLPSYFSGETTTYLDMHFLIRTCMISRYNVIRIA